MPSSPVERTLLLAIDLEEFYGADGAPASSATPLRELVGPILDLLDQSGAHATFFTVGDVARNHAGLVRRIAASGHEIACHGDRHIPLTRLDARNFSDDVRRNADAICALGVPAPRGFRAPLLSLGAEQAWAYPVLRAAGFAYSSSVLPVRTPLGGWPEFGPAPAMRDGVLEIPASVVRVWPLRVPCFCGTYFRVLPEFVARWLLRAAATRGPVVGYLHPYDFDTRQRWTWHAELQGRRVLNHLLFVRRGSLLRRLRHLLRDGWKTMTYAEFAARWV